MFGKDISYYLISVIVMCIGKWTIFWNQQNIWSWKLFNAVKSEFIYIKIMYRKSEFQKNCCNKQSDVKTRCGDNEVWLYVQTLAFKIFLWKPFCIETFWVTHVLWIDVWKWSCKLFFCYWILLYDQKL